MKNNYFCTIHLKRKFTMKKIFHLILISIIPGLLTGQSISPSVIASAGNYYEGTTASVSWTLGEIATETYTSGNVILTQGFQQPISISITGINVDVLVYLEGPFSGSAMNTGLNASGVIPLAQPYNTVPWSYSGTETVTTIPNTDVVDWVLVELRDAANAASATASTRVARQAAFLLKNGTVVGLDGTTNLQFNNSITQQLYIVIWHRNHLGVLSANALSQTGGVYSYDFSTAMTQAYNGGAGYKLIGSGVYGMAGGDNDADGDVDLTDKATWSANAGTAGYKPSDFDLNSQVNNTDKNDVWVENTTLTTQVPN
jgi:hypothetical protein